MLWDIFCCVIDNFGDIGVCWRLSADLAARGHQVRLWVDDASALQWMAPGALQGRWPGIQVLLWDQATNTQSLKTLEMADAWIETFGCEIPQAFVAHFAQRLVPVMDTGPQTAQGMPRPPVWLNLEYLSAEPYVERSHGLPSPVMQGPAKGWIKTFFYPGFTAKTGGLLHEAPSGHALPTSPGTVDPDAFLASLGIAHQAGASLLISLFCYEPPLLGALLDQLAASPQAVHLLVTHGRAAAAVRHLLQARTSLGALRLRYLEPLTQVGYDQLLHSCDINFVRGEDSLVRAIWAGKPFVWHIYPQDDQAHGAKLEAFMDTMQLGVPVRAFHRAWNGLSGATPEAPVQLPLQDVPLRQWQSDVLAARARLLTLPDLGSQLCDFVLKNR